MTFNEWLASCETEVHLHTTTMSRQTQAGGHRSLNRGKGLQFRHHEPYRPGDERRQIDWKLSRKTRHLLVRRFEAEKRLPVVVLCDISPSMLFGHRLAKFRVAQDCAGVLGLATLHQGDAFGLLVFADEPMGYFPPRQHRQAVLGLLEYLWTYEPTQSEARVTRLLPVLQALPVNRPRLLCLLSDLRMPDWQEALGWLSAMHDTIVVWIEDEAEFCLPRIGSLLVRDLESGQLLELDTASTRNRQRYRDQLLVERTAREEALQRLCSGYVVARPSTAYRDDLLRLFLARSTPASG